MLSTYLLLLYAICAVGLFIYGTNCYAMVFFYLKTHRAERKRLHERMLAGHQQLESTNSWPVITTQIPLFNEANVAERVISAVAHMNYPIHKHEIQVLDDSTDETRLLVDHTVEALQQKGYWISVLRRENRRGYKAGALKLATEEANGEFIAIFDADFVPPRDFLQKMVSVMTDSPELGFLQARWGHLNGNDSLLTRAQMLGIDGHFMIEQCARAYNKWFLNFNGTAGMWRKQAIVDAGNWQADTLTEDMDLSYRCQLAGWKASYLPDVVVPAELPESYAAFKSQQFRWAKGSIQTALKLIPRVMLSQSSLFSKVQAFLHLTHYFIHPLMLAMALLALPVLMTIRIDLSFPVFALSAAGILLAMCGPSFLYIVSQVSQSKAHTRKLWVLPGLMCVGVGIAVSNTKAVLEALFGVKSGFVRTPKSGQRTKSYRVKTNALPFIELAMGAYCLVSLLYYVQAEKYLVGPFLGVYTFGFLWIGSRSLLEGVMLRFRLSKWLPRLGLN